MRTRTLLRVVALPLLGISLLLLSGCLRGKETPLRWSNFLAPLANLDHVARLDVPGSAMIASTDPAGGNEDYNQFAGAGPKGWVVLADLKGPGVLTRLWIAGARGGEQRFRFYFDGAWRPSMELTLDELAGGREPFQAPLAAYENDAWYSLVPMPYRKRLVIMTEDVRRGSRLSYQINYTMLPREARVTSFKGDVTEEDRRALADVRRAWQSFDRRPISPSARVAVGILSVQPGGNRWMDPIRGPGVIRRLRVTPKYSRIGSAAERQNLLRDVWLKIRWDRTAAPSVMVPLGDFFGSAAHRVQYRSAFLGLTNETWVCDFPMPFATEAEITLENVGIIPADIELEVLWEPGPFTEGVRGFFHATWSGSMPDDVGQPHAVLRATGRGKFVGCVVSSVSMDRDWSILEGDEMLFVDGESMPRWRGIGMDHYFGIGRSFQGPVARPFHGTLYRTFFGSVQYRLHLADPVNFSTSLDMFIERGAGNTCPAWMQSVAYYYMDQPTGAASTLKPALRLAIPVPPLAEASLMAELLNFERLGDYRGAREHVARYLERFPESRYAPVLRLRQIAYVETLSGLDAAWPLYEQFMGRETDPEALAQAKLLAWFMENPEHALLMLYSSGRAAALINGARLCAVDGPDRVAVVGVKMKPGHHCLALKATGWRQPNWVQACLKMRNGVVPTQPGWRYAFDVAGDWGLPGYDDRDWGSVDLTGVAAPPVDPFIWTEPNAFIQVQAVSAGLTPPGREWPDRQSAVVFRREFDVR